MRWKFWRRARAPQERDDGSPVQVAGVWYAGGLPPQPGAWSAAARTWGRRVSVVTSMARRAVGWVAGVEARGGEQRRAITSLPWVQGGSPAATGSGLTVERALRLAPVFAAGRLLASNVASLPLVTYRGGPGAKQRLPVPPLFQSPSVQGTPHDWKFRLMTSMVYRGNAVGLITSRDRLEYPTGIEWLHPDYVQVIDSMPNLGEPGSYTNPIWYYLGRVVPAENLVHIPWFTLPGKVWGLSPLGAFASTVTTGLAAQEYAQDWFTNGGVPPGSFANANQVVPQEEAEVIKARLVQSIRSRQPIVYGKDWKYEPISVAANEAQFVDTMKLTATQVASIYGIPPEMIGGESGNSMTYANVEAQAVNFVTFTLLPWLTKIEDALSALLPRGQFVKFDVNALLRSDSVSMMANAEKSRLIGLENIDELRDKIDAPPLPNGEGQDYTPLPLAAGKPVAVPAIRGELGKPRLVKEANDG